jgi:hypothetical protein
LKLIFKCAAELQDNLSAASSISQKLNFLEIKRERVHDDLEVLESAVILGVKSLEKK